MNSPANTVDTLNDLIETCRDGEYGFRNSADQAHSESLRSTLLARAQDCHTAADQLRAWVAQLGGTAEDGGSALGSLHRGWVAVKAALSTYDDLAVLEDCERGEDSALTHYRRALEQNLPDPIRHLVEHQYEGAKHNHLQIRTMRDALRTTH